MLGVRVLIPAAQMLDAVSKGLTRAQLSQLWGRHHPLSCSGQPPATPPLQHIPLRHPQAHSYPLLAPPLPILLVGQLTMWWQGHLLSRGCGSAEGNRPDYPQLLRPSDGRSPQQLPALSGFHGLRTNHVLMLPNPSGRPPSKSPWGPALCLAGPQAPSCLPCICPACIQDPKTLARGSQHSHITG